MENKWKKSIEYSNTTQNVSKYKQIEVYLFEHNEAKTIE